MISLPNDYIENMKKLLGKDAGSFFETYEKAPYRGIRFNRRLVDEAAALKIFESLSAVAAAEKVPWTDNGYYQPDDFTASASPFYAAGLYYIQEPSAMSPAAMLPVCKDDIVLDLCAAPGGKATELASRAGFVLANDISASRAKVLLKNLEFSGNANFAVTAMSPDELAVYYPETFDKILVDAPCSGEGMFRKDPSLIKSYIERGPEYYHEIQTEILRQAYKMLKPGGMLLYSTCTFSEIEDERTLELFLNEHSDMDIVHIPDRYEGFEKGTGDFDLAARLYPHKINGEGHFLALLHKSGELVKKYADGSEERRVGDMLFSCPKCFNYEKGIRFLRTGLFLGEYKRDKFIPSLAYALSGRASDKYPQLSFDIKDERLIRYLKGESIFYSDDELSHKEKGYCIICANDYPLGFARCDKGRVKNDYPQGLVWH